MRASRVKFRERRGKMTWCFTNSRIMETFLVLSALYCMAFAEKEFIFNQGNLWDNESKSEGVGTGWSSGEENSVFVCAENSNAKFPLKYINTVDAKRVFVEVEYKIPKRFSAVGGLFFLSNLLESENDSEANKLVETRLVSNTETNRTTKATLHYDIGEDDHFLNLTLYGRKICVQVFKISVYYKVCPTNETLLVSRTAAPSSGFIEASANCSIKQSGKKGSVVVAKCDSEGKWTKVVDEEGGCTNDCGPGTELINDTCTVCKENYYKKTRGTDACLLCPENTVSEHSRTGCKCKARHYRNSENDPCGTIPSKPKNLRYTRLPFNTILLHWNASQKDALVTRGLHFRVQCKEYYGITSSVWRPCNLSLGDRGMNVTGSPLVIKHLLNNTNYTISVIALNDVSVQVSEEEWMSATIVVHLAGKVSKDVDNKTHDNGTSTESTSSSVIPSDNPKVTSEGTPTTTLRPTSASSDSQHGETISQNETENKTQLAPYIGIAIGATLFIFILFVVVLYRRKRVKKKTLGTEEDFLMNPCPQAYVDPAKYGNTEKAVRRFAKEIDRREIKLEGLIGEGEFAKVHKGMLCRPNEPPVPVALKVLKPGSTAKNREDFLTEAAVMGQFKDLNIVALEGVVTISHPVMIITEFMHNGALSNYLVQNKNRFSEIELLGMARGIASGMKYLAKMRFVHRDLAARNVLVNENLVCKVADFGLTRELEESSQGEYVTQGGKIPIRWTAPEAYKHRRFTTASDVWSFGIVLWEIMSYADRPYGDWDNYMVMEQVTANYRLFAPTNCPKIIHQLMTECWKADRSQRPSFSDIVEMLERWIRNPYLLKDYQYVTEKGRMADRKSCVAKSIRDYLEAIKMDRYIDNFIDFGYTELYQIQNMTDDDLVGIGVPLIGHRNKIIKSLRGEKELLLPVDV